MTRLLIRLNTVSGSRTIIGHDMLTRDAVECREALADMGLAVVATEDATPVDMRAVLRRRKRVGKVVPSNVHRLEVKK